MNEKLDSEKNNKINILSKIQRKIDFAFLYDHGFRTLENGKCVACGEDISKGSSTAINNEPPKGYEYQCCFCRSFIKENGFVTAFAQR